MATSSSSLSQDFLELLHKSGLVAKDRLETWLKETGRTPAAAQPLAALLVRDGLLTSYQAERLLEGKWQHFILKHKYKILKKLGEGGWSSVFLCEHLTMNRRVAVKVLLPKLASNPAVVQRFLREAAAVGALDHPNIVHAFDFDCDANLYFLATEFVEGTDLHQLVTRKGPLNMGRAVSCVAQAAAGLQYAFRAGWVHRDIKPSNLLVDAAGKVKILDLGLARLFHDDQDSLTREFDKEATLGTADFMAPEQALNSHEVDIRADIYSLGATLYFLLSGRAPFADCSATQKLMMHLNRPPRPVRELRPEVSAELAAVLERMMAKNPADRYQTPAEVDAAIRSLPEFSSSQPGAADSSIYAADPTVVVPRAAGLPLSSANIVPSESTLVRRRLQQVASKRRWVLFNIAGGCLLVLLVGVVLALVGRSTPSGIEPGPAAVAPAAAPPAPIKPPRPATRPFKMFDGAQKTIVVVNNNYGGHDPLKTRLDRQPGAERIKLKNQSTGAFTGPSLSKRETPPAWCPRSNLVKNEGPVIYIVLGGAGVGVDSEGVRLPSAPGRLTADKEQNSGLALMGASVQQASARGIDLVILTNAFYKRKGPAGAGGTEPYPALIQAFNQTELGQRHPAVDLFTPFQARHPLAHHFDVSKSSEAGKQLMAHTWFAALCAWDGIAVPDWSQKLVDQAFSEEHQRRQLITHVRPRGGETYQVGDTLTISWKCDPSECSRVAIHVIHEDSKAPRPVPIASGVKVTGPDGGSYQWVIPELFKQKAKDLPLEPGSYRIVVQKASGQQEWGASEGTFTITRK